MPSQTNKDHASIAKIVIYKEKQPLLLADDKRMNCYEYTMINVRIFQCDRNTKQAHFVRFAKRLSKLRRVYRLLVI